MIFQKETTLENLDLPTLIYKYRDWTKEEHQRLLTHNEIHFDSPLSYKESFEFNLPFDYDAVNDQDLFQYYFQTADPEIYPNRKAKRDIAKKMVKENLINTPKFKENAQKENRIFMSSHFSLFCASPFRNISRLWIDFANYQTGFCVGFNTKKMFDNTEIFGSGGWVNYYNEKQPPKIRPFCLNDDQRMEKANTIIYNLPNLYKSEREYRLVKLNLENFNHEVPTESFEEIILGSNMSREKRIEIIQIAAQRFPSAILLQANYDEEVGLYE